MHCCIVYTDNNTTHNTPICSTRRVPTASIRVLSCTQATRRRFLFYLFFFFSVSIFISAAHPRPLSHATRPARSSLRTHIHTRVSRTHYIHTIYTLTHASGAASGDERRRRGWRKRPIFRVCLPSSPPKAISPLRLLYSYPTTVVDVRGALSM